MKARKAFKSMGKPHPHYDAVDAAESKYQLTRMQILEQTTAEFNALLQQALKERIGAAFEKRNQAFRAAGLDPATAWQLNEFTRTITKA